MKVEILDKQILKADEGMYLTDGVTFGKVVEAPLGADISIWKEITEAEKEEKEKKLIEEE